MQSARQPIPLSTAPGAPPRPGIIVRKTRTSQGLTLAELGERVGYSAAQVSRYERGIAPLTDVVVLRRFASALAIPPQVFGLASTPVTTRPRHGNPVKATARPSHDPSSTVAGGPGWEGGEDPVRRRELLANLVVTAAAASVHGITTVRSEEAATGERLTAGVRDAMLVSGTLSRSITPRQAVAEYDRLGQDEFLAHYACSRLGQALAACWRTR